MKLRLALVSILLVLLALVALLPYTPEPEGEPLGEGVGTVELASVISTTTIPTLQLALQQKPVEPASTDPLKRAVTTVFWVGEKADASNDFIANDESAWDSSWQKHYGGVDSPDDRCGYAPCAFTPKENPFYVALPYNDLTSKGVRRESSYGIPWYRSIGSASSLLKNRWVEVSYREKICYGQWEDVGPNEEDDFAYVFGTSTVPRNTFGEKAGLDISPALRDCLGVTGLSITYWRFIEERDVPNGPWRETITESGVRW